MLSQSQRKLNILDILYVDVDEDMMRQRHHLYAQGNVISRSLQMCSIAVKNTLFCTFCTSFSCISTVVPVKCLQSTG